MTRVEVEEALRVVGSTLDDLKCEQCEKKPDRIFMTPEPFKILSICCNTCLTSYSTFKPPSEIASEALAFTDEVE